MSDMETLIQIAKKLADHSEEMDSFHMVYDFSKDFYGIDKGVDSQENVLKIFSQCIQRRGGPLLKAEEVYKLRDKFVEQVLDNGDLQKPSTEGDFKNIRRKIMGLEGIGPKITDLFLKNMVYYGQIWPELEEYLYVPLDIHVRRFFIQKARIWKYEEFKSDLKGYLKNNDVSQKDKTEKKNYLMEKYLPYPNLEIMEAGQSRRDYRRFMEFQNMLKDATSSIGEPRIIFDYIWYIGNRFCKEKWACEFCWLKEFCKDPQC